MSIKNEKYVSFTTFRKNGERKSAPVWITETPNGQIGFTTGTGSWKLRRLKNDDRCELQPCDQRGRVAEGATVVTGSARQADAAEFESISQSISSKYGIQAKIIPLIYKVSSFVKRDKSAGGAADTAIVVSID